MTEEMTPLRTLLVDADDTLWENNIYFERLIGEFLEKLAQYDVPPSRAREILQETDQRNIKMHGYGIHEFCDTLLETARVLGAGVLEPWIAEREKQIAHHPIELLPGVRETLPILYAKNQLIMVTKGQVTVQLDKLQRSGLASFFHAIEVVTEKSTTTYHELTQKYGLSVDSTWMIGNSTRFDINPARLAGLGTILIPYHAAWNHEIDETLPGSETLVVESFAALCDYFG